MNAPGSDRAAQYANSEPSKAAAAPTRGCTQKNQRQITSPGKQEEVDFRIEDPFRAAIDEYPDDADYSANRNEHKTEIERNSDEPVERCQWRQLTSYGRYFLALQLALLHQVHDSADGSEYERGVADQNGRNVQYQPGVADLRIHPRRHRKLRRADQRHEKYERKNANRENGDAVVAIRNQEQHRNQERAERCSLVEVAEGEMAEFRPQFHDRNQVENRACAERKQGRRE